MKAQSTRKVYPFSVIYGGAYSGEELARARKLDRVVALHYAGFRSSAKVQRLPKDTFMYVSYRRSNRVFWTKTKRRIPQGEAVLSDGENLARTRCGNRLSPNPQAPVASGGEPTDETLDMPEGPKAPLITSSPIPSAPDADFFVPASPGELTSFLPPNAASAPAFPSSVVPGIGLGPPYGFGSYGAGSGPFLGNNLFYPGGVGSSTAGSGTAIAVTDYQPANGLVTPEPSTLPLQLVGILLGIPILVCKWRKSAKSVHQK